MLLRLLLGDSAAAEAIELGVAFLAERCREGSHATLVALLSQAGLTYVGACWKDGMEISGIVFAPPDTKRMRLQLHGPLGRFEYEVPSDGRQFRLPVPHAGSVWSVLLATPSGSTLMSGSPLSFEPLPAVRGSLPLSTARRAVAVVLPVYRGDVQVRACVESVLASLASNRTTARLVVIDDATPEPALSAWLADQAGAGRLTLLRNLYNLGFIDTVNRGLRHCASEDVLLLNADTLVHGNWIDRLAAALDGAPDVAAVSPWSNNGEVTSFPDIGTAAPMPDAALLRAIDTVVAAQRCSDSGADIELPACCGFAMLMGRDAIDHVGVFDGNGLRRGYGEEVDWCLRARAAGYRLLAATGVYVAHAGGVSFGREKMLRVRQNRAVLAARYPDYFDDYQRFLRADPLADVRANLAAALASGSIDAPARALARPAALPAALPRAGLRIAVWRHRAGAAQAPQILRLARLLATRAPALPSLRLLVTGEAVEALWRTGVVDVLPLQADAEPLLDDATLLGLAGCTVVLAEPDLTIPDGVPVVRLDADFDAATWLATWLDTWPSARGIHSHRAPIAP